MAFIFLGASFFDIEYLNLALLFTWVSLMPALMLIPLAYMEAKNHAPA